MNDNRLMERAADNIRILSVAMVEKAKSGHPGGAMGGADFINVLFSEYLEYDPENPRWEGRDRFFLDPGHMSPMLYSVLALSGRFSYRKNQTFRHKNILHHLKIWFCLLEVTIQPSDNLILAITTCFVKSYQYSKHRK